jgi:hypothetical protein
MKKWLTLAAGTFVLAAVLTFGFGAPAEAIPGCGDCRGGTTGENFSCSGDASNCAECTACAV